MGRPTSDPRDQVAKLGLPSREGLCTPPSAATLHTPPSSKLRSFPAQLRAPPLPSLLRPGANLEAARRRWLGVQPPPCTLLWRVGTPDYLLSAEDPPLLSTYKYTPRDQARSPRPLPIPGRGDILDAPVPSETVGVDLPTRLRR